MTRRRSSTPEPGYAARPASPGRRPRTRPDSGSIFDIDRDAFGGRPGYGFFEILNSAWPGRLIAYNRHAFPDRTPPHYAALRHYFIGCHDASGEFSPGT